MQRERSSRGNRWWFQCGAARCATGAQPLRVRIPFVSRRFDFTKQIHLTTRMVSSPGPPTIDFEYLMDANSLVVLLNGAVIHFAERMPVRSPQPRGFQYQQQQQQPAPYAPAPAVPAYASRTASRPPAIAVGVPAGLA